MKKFAKLRALLHFKDISFGELSELFGVSNSTISLRMSGAVPWGIDEIYKVCEYLDIPYAEIPLYFPPNGDTISEADILPRVSDKVRAIVTAYEDTPEMQNAVDTLLNVHKYIKELDDHRRKAILKIKR